MASHGDIVDFPLEAGPHGSPSPLLAELRERCPVARLRAPSGAVLDVLTRYDDVEYAHRAFSRRVAVVGGPEFVPGENHNAQYSMSAMDPPEHTRLRGLIGPTFAPRRVAAWEPMVRRIADGVVAAMRASGATEGDLVIAFCLEMPVRVICELLGVSREEIPHFRRWSDAFITTTDMPAAERLKLVDEFRDRLTKLVDERRAGPGEGLVGDLIRARDEDGDRFSDEELVSMVLALVVAGHETTASVLARGVATLLRHPETLAELKADPKLWPSAVEEILRYDSLAVGGLLRRVVEDTTLPSGGRLEAGAHVLANLSAANHDPARFPDPGRFDIHRADVRHLAFGQGPHYCVGAPLARLELQVGFPTLFAAFPDLRLTVAPEWLEWTSGTRVRTLKALPVAWG